MEHRDRVMDLARAGDDLAALGDDRRQGLAEIGLGQLVGAVQAVVREAGAQVLQVLDAEHLGSQLGADLVEQVLQRVVERDLAGARAHGVDLVELGEIGPDRRSHGAAQGSFTRVSRQSPPRPKA